MLPEQLEEAQNAADEHTAHLQAILEHADNDLSPNDQAALRYFIDLARRPSFKETVRLDTMWQHLVREKFKAERSLLSFRKREPLVESLVVGVLGLPFEPEQHAQAAMKLRDFKVSE